MRKFPSSYPVLRQSRGTPVSFKADIPAPANPSYTLPRKDGIPVFDFHHKERTYGIFNIDLGFHCPYTLHEDMKSFSTQFNHYSRAKKSVPGNLST